MSSPAKEILVIGLGLIGSSLAKAAKNKGLVVHNGTKIVEFPLSGEEWDAMVAPTKFNNCDQKPWHNCDFGKFKTGKISIQDHPGIISFRTIKILEL